MLKVQYVVDSSRVSKMLATAISLIKQRSSTTQRRVLKDWQEAWQSFLIKRYRVASSGGGPWRPLSPATIAARRRRGVTGTRLTLILRDTDQLFHATGQSYKPVGTHNGFGIEVQFPRRRHSRARMLIGDLAEIHHFGRGRVPARRIVVQPTAQIKRRMAQLLKAWFTRASDS